MQLKVPFTWKQLGVHFIDAHQGDDQDEADFIIKAENKLFSWSLSPTPCQLGFPEWRVRRGALFLFLLGIKIKLQRCIFDLWGAGVGGTTKQIKFEATFLGGGQQPPCPQYWEALSRGHQMLWNTHGGSGFCAFTLSSHLEWWQQLVLLDDKLIST